MTDEDEAIDHKLARDGTLFENIEVLTTRIEPTVGNEDWHVRIDIQLDEDLVAAKRAAWPSHAQDARAASGVGALGRYCPSCPSVDPLQSPAR